MSDAVAPGLWFGGDYNPEQWDADVLAEDEALMRHAGVNTATVGVFSWSVLEPAEGRYAFEELDRTLDRLHANGVRVVLATPTASPPPWFGAAHPDALPVTADGIRLSHGSRDTYCAAAPAYRQAARAVAEALAVRYADHPALALWHVHNEYGTRCHCDHSAVAFRRWLRARYDDDLEQLDAAWNGAFWSQRYSDWEQVLPPRTTQYLPNPGHVLDFARFWSDELLAAYREQADVLRRHTPDVPVTTNLMLPSGWQHLDPWRWAAEVDVVAVDLYPETDGVDGRAELAFSADRARSFGGGRPWLLMEQAVGLVHRHDRGVMTVLEPGRILADSLACVARGSDAVMFFQWRAGRGGAEQHHGAMVPPAGPRTRVFREVTELGSALGRLGELAGSTVRAAVALLWDADARWALDAPGLPSRHLRYVPLVREWHTALWRAGVTTDVVHPEGDLARYRMVLAPGAYLCSDVGVAALRRYVDGGGHLVLGCFSMVADEHQRVRTGGWPGGLLDVVGVRVEEVHPAATGDGVQLTGGWTGAWWSESLDLVDEDDVDVLARYAGGVLAGRPAVTRHRFGTGTAWYVSTRLDEVSLAAFVGQVLAATGTAPELLGAPLGVEAVRRHTDDGRSWLFLQNLGTSAVDVPATGVDLLTGRAIDGALWLAAGGVAVVAETGPRS